MRGLPKFETTSGDVHYLDFAPEGEAGMPQHRAWVRLRPATEYVGGRRGLFLPPAEK